MGGGSDADIDKYKNQVDVLDERVGDLEAVVRELEEWTGELGMVVLMPSRMRIDSCVQKSRFGGLHGVRQGVLVRIIGILVHGLYDLDVCV